MFRFFIYIPFFLVFALTQANAQDNTGPYPPADSLYKLAQNYTHQSNWTEAINAYKTILKQYPDQPNTHVALANIYRQNGIWSKAVEHYQNTLALAPQHPQAQHFLPACQQALSEQKDLGYVQAATLHQLVILENQTQNLTRGFASATSSIPLHIEFGSGQYALEDLSANGRAQLEQAAQLLQSAEWQGKEIAIEGHTCTCGAADSNKAMAHKRAATVRDFLVDQGAIPSTAIQLIPHGETKTISGSPHENLPPIQCDIDVLHSMDRRVVIRQVNSTTTNTASLLPPTQISFWHRPKNKDAFLQLEDGAILYSGDEFRIFMMAQDPVYAYLFHHGSGGDWVCLFPNENFSLEAPAKNPLEAGRKYWLPRFSGGFVLDDTPGQEETLVYLSTEPHPTMEKWKTEGVPQETVETEKQRGFGGIVEVQSAVDTIAWHLRLRFQHAQHP